jgi:hypothetical protein
VKKYHDIKNVSVSKDKLQLMVDGKEYEFKIGSFSEKLASAGEKEKNNYEISPSGYGIHWTLIDVDISIDGLLKQKIGGPKKKKILV